MYVSSPRPGIRLLIRYFLEHYRTRSLVLVLALGLAGLAEGFGVLSILPLLELAMDDAPAGGGPERIVLAVVAALGLAPTLASLLVVAVGALWLKAGFRWWAMRRAGDTVARVARDLRIRLMRALMAARVSHLDTERSGELATALGRDAFWASYAYRHAVGAAAAAIQLAVYAGVILLLSWRLGAAALIAAAGMAVILGVFVRMSRRAGAEQTRLARSLSSRLLDVVGGMKAIKAMGRERWYLPVLERHADDLERAERRQVLAVESLRVLYEPLLALVLAPLVWLAVVRTDVQFATLVLAVFLFHRLMGYAHLVQTDYQGLAAAEAAFTALHRQSMVAEADREPDTTGGRYPRLDRELEAREVSVSYDGRPVLERLTLDFPAHRITAITGASGVGKTTLLELLLGLRQPDSGRIYVDGVPLDELDAAAWRRGIGYVPQEAILLDGSMARNVTLGEEVPDDEVERALRRAGALELVRTLPEGIHSQVGERGARLSGGERQRVAIARALLHDPLLLVLDEPTSELDAAAEARICATLRSLVDGVTVIVASHRSAVLDAADHHHDLNANARSPTPAPP